MNRKTRLADLQREPRPRARRSRTLTDAVRQIMSSVLANSTYPAGYECPLMHAE